MFYCFYVSIFQLDFAFSKSYGVNTFKFQFVVKNNKNICAYLQRPHVETVNSGDDKNIESYEKGT